MPKAEQPGDRKPPAPTGNGKSPEATAAKTGEARGAETRAEEALSSTGLDQIREILFGSAHRELERRLGRTDTHLSSRAREVEQEGRRRTEVVESHLKQELEVLAQRLERDRAETADSLRKLSREHHEAVANLEQKLVALEGSIGETQRETRGQLLAQAKSFLDELQRMREELLVTFQEGLAGGDLTGDFRDGEEHVAH